MVDVVGRPPPSRCSASTNLRASAVATGTGTVRSAHGLLPNPAPATVRLLEGIPAYGRDVPIELPHRPGPPSWPRCAPHLDPCPTSASPPRVRGRRRRARRPAQLHPGGDRPAGGASAVGPGQPALLLETNLDDVTGEQLGYAVASALESGALDAWVTSVTMKKGRPGHVLHVLTDARPAGRATAGDRAGHRHARRASHARSSAGPRPGAGPGGGRRHDDPDESAVGGPSPSSTTWPRWPPRPVPRSTTWPAGPRRPGGRARTAGPKEGWRADAQRHVPLRPGHGRVDL